MAMIQLQIDDQRMSLKQWLAIRKEEAPRINAQKAKVSWSYGQIMDPYGADPYLPPEYDCVGRVYFARNPDSNIWVSFYDLPTETCDVLWARMKSQECDESDDFLFSDD